MGLKYAVIVGMKEPQFLQVGYIAEVVDVLDFLKIKSRKNITIQQVLYWIWIEGVVWQAPS